MPGLIWDLGQQLGDLSLEQESGRSSGEHGSREQGPLGYPSVFHCPPPSGSPVSVAWSPPFSSPWFPQPSPLFLSPFLPNPGFYEDPSSTGGPDSPPSTFCGDSGFSGSGSYGRLGPSEPRGIYASERPKSLGKVGGWGPDGQGNNREKMVLSTLLSQTNLNSNSGRDIPFRVMLSLSLLSGPLFLHLLKWG